MDESVERSLAKWPGVPAVFGWLGLDRRGNWLLKNPASGALERIGNAALSGFIARNYAHDDRGRWYFQNGPQRVFVSLAYTPLVARLEDGRYSDQCGRLFDAAASYLDDEGSVLLAGYGGVALLDDRDLGGFVAQAGDALDTMPRIARGEVAERFAFVADPQP